MGNVPHVLVLGGGYAAITLTKALRRRIENGQIECTVVSRENFHAFHGFVGEMLTGKITPSNILSPARRLFPPARLHLAEVEKIDLDSRTVITSRSLDGRRAEHTYDHLVVALGTEDRVDVYPGLAEHAFKLRRYADCFALRNHLLEMFELAEIETDPDERRRLLTFFIAGGGYAGTEVAGELAHFARTLAGREYPGLRADECRFLLVEPGDTIVPELYGARGEGAKAHPRLVEKAMGRQRELGVEVLTNTYVMAATPNEVVLSNGDHIPARTIISAVGTKAAPVVDRLQVEKDERGRIVTDRALRVPGRPGVWAAGDCAAVPLPRGEGTCPPVAVYALKHGHKVGDNIGRVADGQRPRRFKFPGVGQGASVGNRYAVAEVKGVEVWGLPAWLLWRGYLYFHFPTWDRRLRLLADWVLWPLVGRDIVEMRVARPEDYELRENRFQPGETILVEGGGSRYVHVIVEGEVELVEVARGEERVLKVIGPGEHFGVRWMESFEPEEARAKTEVRTIAIRRDQAPRLQEVLAAAGRIVAESGHFPAITREMESAMASRPSPTPPAT